jgi:TIR domain
MQSMPLRIFLSWSGECSRSAASAVRKWLPYVVPDTEPYLSSDDIDAGSRWTKELDSQLERSHFGILFLTPDNIESFWVAFEAGALAKIVGRAKIVPLLIGLDRNAIQPPLSHFQSVSMTKEGMYNLVKSVNSSCERPTEIDRLDEGFKKW